MIAALILRDSWHTSRSNAIQTKQSQAATFLSRLPHELLGARCQRLPGLVGQPWWSSPASTAAVGQPSRPSQARVVRSAAPLARSLPFCQTQSTEFQSNIYSYSKNALYCRRMMVKHFAPRVVCGHSSARPWLQALSSRRDMFVHCSERGDGDQALPCVLRAQ